VKRTIKRIEGRLFVVNVYRRIEKDLSIETLAFDIIAYTDRKIDRRNHNNRFRG
jgi:hypothetical protein